MPQLQIGRVLAHWETMLAGVAISPLAFYAAVERAVATHQIPMVMMARVTRREGGLFSARRQYLRARRRSLVFDVCGFPVGADFQVTWWLGETEPGLRELFGEIPIVGLLLDRVFSPATYYELDAEAHFQHAIHASVLEVIDELTSRRGLRRLPPRERRPVMREFYK
jgi:hypothetical protein